MPHQPPFYVNAAFWLYFLTWLPFVLFVAVYARRPWRSTAPGRAVMTLAVALTVVLTYVLVLFVFPQIPAQVKDILRLVCLGGVSLSGWVMLKTLRDAR